MEKSAHLKKKPKRCVTQRCVLSPDLFSPYCEIIIKNLEKYPGIEVGGYNVHNVRYAAETVLIRHLGRRKQKERV